MFSSPVHLANSNLFPNYFKTTAVSIRPTCSFVSLLTASFPSMAPVTHTGPHSGFKAKKQLGYYGVWVDASVRFCRYSGFAVEGLLLTFIASHGMMSNILYVCYNFHVGSMALGIAMAISWFTIISKNIE